MKKTLKNSRLLKNTGSWLYCDHCDKTVGYICYSTYQSLMFEFECKCGSSGSLYLNHDTDKSILDASKNLKKIKNRLCCPDDDAPLFTIVEKHIENFSYTVVCNKCLHRYIGGKRIERTQAVTPPERVDNGPE